MSLNRLAFAGAILTLCGAVAPTPVAAQPVNCVELYNHMLAVYQVAPWSPEYSQMSAVYSANCLPGPPVVPVYPYAQPVPVDPGAAIVGGIIGGALEDHAWRERQRRERERHERRREWREDRR